MFVLWRASLPGIIHSIKQKLVDQTKIIFSLYTAAKPFQNKKKINVKQKYIFLNFAK